MSGNWTPGPWDWQFLELPYGRLVGRAGNMVLDHASYEGMWLAAYDPKIDQANARLIAAAPDLYAALEAACEYENRDAFYEERLVAPWYEAAANALLKARGEAQ